MLGSAFTAEAAAAFKKAFDHVTDIMTAKATRSVNGVVLDPTVKRISAGQAGLPAKTKGLIRDAWYLARRNADIAPKLFIKSVCDCWMNQMQFLKLFMKFSALNW